MPDYRKIARKTGRVLLWTAGVFLILGAIALFLWNYALPGYAEKLTDEILRESFGLNRTGFRVRRLGLAGLDLENFTLTGSDGKTLRIDSVRADYDAHLRFRKILNISTLTVAGGDIHVALRDGKLDISGFDLDNLLAALQRNAAKPKKPGEPVVTLHKIHLRDIRLHLDMGGKLLTFPLNAEITSADGAWKQISADLDLSFRGQSLELTGNYDAEISAFAVSGGTRQLRLATFADLAGISVGGGARLKFDAVGRRSGDSFQLSGRIDAELDPRNLPVEFTEVLKLTQNIDLRYKSNELTAILAGSAAPPVFTFNKGTVKSTFARPAEWKCVLTRRPGEKPQITDLEFKAESGTIDAYGYTLDVPQLRLADRTLIAEGMRLVNPKFKIDAEEIRLAIPLPFDEAHPAALHFGSVRYAGKLLGSAASTFHTGGGEMKLGGTFVNKILPGARVDFRGGVTPRAGQMPDMLFELNLPPWTPEQPIDLGSYIPKLAGVNVSGVVSLGGAAKVENGELATGIQLLLEKGKADWEAKKLHAEDIRLKLRFTDLLKFVTPGNQDFRVGSLKAGNFTFEDIRVIFEIASREQIDFERIEGGWCGGTLMLHSIGVNPMKPDNLSIKSSLFCENLQLSRIVKQLNLGNATGEGALFGKIPFSYSRQRGIIIDSSYLYSRPGTVNTILITNPEKLVGNLDEAALRHTQLDFATEALRDFSYSWAKMNFDTERATGDLLVSLQFDGKPNKPLPFSYDGDSGQLTRDPNSKAHFEGIQLNLNTRLPLQGLLNLNNLLK